MVEAADNIQAGSPGPRRRAAAAPRFALRFSARLIPGLPAANADDDREAFEAGRRIAAGSRARTDLLAIFEWKTRGRGRSRPARNNDAEIADALDLALAARTDRAAVAVLTGLSGVHVPVASAVMTAIHPHRFTILDFRALWSLGIERATYSVGFYLEYLAACRRIAAAAGSDLRTLDKALWQNSRDHQPPGR